MEYISPQHRYYEKNKDKYKLRVKIARDKKKWKVLYEKVIKQFINIAPDYIYHREVNRGIINTIYTICHKCNKIFNPINNNEDYDECFICYNKIIPSGFCMIKI